jgi:E3 ubiquitin-protein ligase TRIP12
VEICQFLNPPLPPLSSDCRKVLLEWSHSKWSQCLLAVMVRSTRCRSCVAHLMYLSSSDSRRNSASLLARQLRLRLVGEGSDIPKSCTNITVSIHAIATFQALNDYLRPRVSSQGLPPGSRISGMLAAFAAAAGIPSSALSRPPNSTAGQSVAGSSSTTDDASTATATTSTAAATGSNTVVTGNGEEVTKHGKGENGPRRSRRLSAKDVSMSGATAPTTPAPSPSVPKAPAPPSQGSSEPRTESIEMDDPEEGFIDAEVESFFTVRLHC